MEHRESQQIEMAKKVDTAFLVKTVERAMKLNDIKSRRALARHLDVSHQTIQYWIDGSTTPENAIMVKLAELAKIDPGLALLRINRARAKNKREKRVWSGLIKDVKGR